MYRKRRRAREKNVGSIRSLIWLKSKKVDLFHPRTILTSSIFLFFSSWMSGKLLSLGKFDRLSFTECSNSSSRRSNKWWRTVSLLSLRPKVSLAPPDWAHIAFTRNGWRVCVRGRSRKVCIVDWNTSLLSLSFIFRHFLFICVSPSSFAPSFSFFFFLLMKNPFPITCRSVSSTRSSGFI